MSNRRPLVVGALLGLVVTIAVFLYELVAIAKGEDPRSLGFGVSHGLFLFCAPWSLIVYSFVVVIGMTFGLDGPAFLRPFFFSMPVVAGAGWGWLLGFLGEYLERRRNRRIVRIGPSNRRHDDC
jgi:polyferredoxin